MTPRDELIMCLFLYLIILIIINTIIFIILYILNFIGGLYVQFLPIQLGIINVSIEGNNSWVYN